MLDKTYDPKDIEARRYAEWEQSGAFECKPDSGKPPYCIVIPPPNVTGSLHLGHALVNTIQDILIRWRRMKGDDVLWQPGIDHAGIATQMVVTRQLAEQGIGLATGEAATREGNRQQLNREEFVARVWEWKAESGGIITQQLRRLGASCDWRRERFTMDEGLSQAVLKVFVDLYKQGLIYKDTRLVNWDPKMLTAISDLEVESQEVKGSLWYIRYPIEGDEGRYIVVATTRPETMLGDTAVAVHPDDPTWKHLIGRHAILPVAGRRIPIIADEYSDPEKGSGAVKITPAHDFNDFEVGRRHGLRAVSVLDRSARLLLNDNADFLEGLPRDAAVAVVDKYHGLDRFEARKKLVSELEGLDLIEKIEPHTHTVPYGDRGGVPIEPFLTEQWYVNAKEMAKGPIEAARAGDVAFVPARGRDDFFRWMENIQPWCVSRQLWWGHQIPAWYDEQGNVFVELNEADAQAAARAKHGHDVPLSRDPDVLDTWFSSALWPFSTLGWPQETKELRRYYPTDVLVTATDILFFWVARMMMMGMHFMQQVPFRTVYLHGLITDEKGQKMSKSKGNIIDPLDLIDKYGADALRFTMAAIAIQARLGQPLKLSPARVEGYRNFATKLWNATRFSQMNGVAVPSGFDPASATLTVNKWVLGELARCAATVDQAIAEFRFNDAASALYVFVWGTVCDWYVEFTKPWWIAERAASESFELLRKSPNYNRSSVAAKRIEAWFEEETPERGALILFPQGSAEAQDPRFSPLVDKPIRAIRDEFREIGASMGFVLRETVKLLHPIMPFITEEIWDKLGHRAEVGALISQPWPHNLPSPNVAASDEMTWLVKLITEIRSVRAETNVPASAKLKLIVRDADEVTRVRLVAHESPLMRLARIEAVELDHPVPSGVLQLVIGEATYALPVAEVIDLKAERARLDKEIRKLEGEVSKIEAKLSNAQFLAKAPEEVVEEQRERREEALSTAARLRQATARLAV